MVRSNASSLALLLAASLGAVACKAEDGGTDTASSRYQQNTQQGQYGGDGCSMVPQSFDDGTAFERFSGGQVRKAVVVKVDNGATSAGGIAGASGFYGQTSASAADPASVGKFQMGTHNGREYKGGQFQALSLDSSNPSTYVGIQKVWPVVSFKRSGGGVVMELTSNRMTKVVGVGRFLERKDRSDLYVISPVNGACFGAVRREAYDGINSGIQMSGEGGKAGLWIGSMDSSSGNGGDQMDCAWVERMCRNRSDRAGCVARVDPKCAPSQQGPNEQQQAPTYNQQAPTYNQQAPTYNQQAPTYNQQAQPGSNTQQRTSPIYTK